MFNRHVGRTALEDKQDIREYLTERDKINRLLASMGSSEYFYRIDGTNMYGREAEKHLKARWDHRKIRTANEFIRLVAAKSTVKGEINSHQLPYPQLY